MGKRLLKCNLFMPASHFEVIGFFPILMSVQSNVLHYYCVTCVSMILFILFCVQLRSVNNWKTCLSLQILHFIWPGRGSWPNPGALLVWKLKKKKKRWGHFQVVNSDRKKTNILNNSGREERNMPPAGRSCVLVWWTKLAESEWWASQDSIHILDPSDEKDVFDSFDQRTPKD